MSLVELPPLPPVDGYDKRVQGHYSAHQMREYARASVAALAASQQEQACSGLGIDRAAQELLEQHTVAVPVAVEDGRCFMVREHEALDAIRAALARVRGAA